MSGEKINKDVNWMDLQKFKDEGWLQEANRLFFHPRGLALAVDIEDGKVTGIAGLWDYREDPEGVVFDELTDSDWERALKIEEQRKFHLPARQAILISQDGIQFPNDEIQPVPEED